MTHERWLLERAVAMLEVFMADLSRVRLVNLPPEGAKLLEIERAALIAALERTQWVQRDAAQLLSIPPRVMQYKVQKYGLRAEGTKMRRGGGSSAPRQPTPRSRGKDWRLQPWQ